MSTPNESSPRRGRRAPTAEELLNAVADLPPDQAQAVLGRAQPAPADPDAYRRGRPIPEAGPPAYQSWNDYLARTNRTDIMAWCRAKAKKANAPRLMSEAPGDRLTGRDVWAIMEAAQGRCAYCGSLAVEKRPSTSTGQPLQWEHVGRRIGCSATSSPDSTAARTQQTTCAGRVSGATPGPTNAATEQPIMVACNSTGATTISLPVVMK